MQHTERVGTRVATIRKIRGWTARELAAQAHVSYSLLTKVESGHAAATPAFIGAVARALRVDVPRLTGQPYEEPRGSGARLHATIGPIRRSIDTYDLPDDTINPRPVQELAADVRRISALGGDAKFVQIGEILPGLLDELTTAVHAASLTDRPQLFGLLAEAYARGLRPAPGSCGKGQRHK
jgi:transcriptional regulator with XRE-family HTH domain